MIYEYFALTDAGRVRTNNEDAVAVDAELGLGLLADGMGGHNAGEVAAQMAVSLIRAELGGWLSQHKPSATVSNVRDALENSVIQAHRSIFNAGQTTRSYAGMGTTLVAGVFHMNQLVLCHVGDSRCYRWRREQLTQITHDHSVLQERIDAGLITPQAAATSLDGNLVTRAMGVERVVVPEIHEHTVLHGDVYLMCSDGLSDLVSNEVIAEILAADSPLAETGQRLVREAILQGGLDNITVLLTRAQETRNRSGNIMNRRLAI